MENLLDEARRGEMQLNADIINLFWKRKILCRNSSTPIKAQWSLMPTVLSTFAALRQLALEAKGETAPSVVNSAKLSVVDSTAMQEEAVAKPELASEESKNALLSRLKASEVDLLEEELGNPRP